MIIDGYKINSFTNLNEKFCIGVLEMVEFEFGEIGDFLIEEDEVSFRVYRGYFEDAPNLIDRNGIELKLIDKFDYNFSLAYKIILKS